MRVCISLICIIFSGGIKELKNFPMQIKLLVKSTGYNSASTNGDKKTSNNFKYLDYYDNIKNAGKCFGQIVVWLVYVFSN